MKEKTDTINYSDYAWYWCLEGMDHVKQMELLDPLKLCFCGAEQCRPRHRFGPAEREHFLIHVVLSGKGIYRRDKQEYHLKKGQAFLIRPGEEVFYRADPEDPWAYAWMGFQGYKANSVLEEMGFKDGAYVIDLDDPKQIGDEITNILKYKEESYANDLGRKSVFYSFLAAMVCENEKKKEKNVEKSGDELRRMYVRRATEYIVSYYDKKIRISDIAGEIGLNRSYLTNIFKKEMNMSPQDFLITFRLQKAAQLLRNTSESVRNIAYSTGYDDSLSFAKAFKQKYSMTPSAYRAAAPGDEEENEGISTTYCNV